MTTMADYALMAGASYISNRAPINQKNGNLGSRKLGVRSSLIANPIRYDR
jgi:hypothetical protein